MAHVFQMIENIFCEAALAEANDFPSPIKLWECVSTYFEKVFMEIAFAEAGEIL